MTMSTFQFDPLPSFGGRVNVSCPLCRFNIRSIFCTPGDEKNVAHVSKKQNINTSSKTDVQKAMYKQCNFRLDLQPDTDLHTTAKIRLAGQINSCYDCRYRVSDKTDGHSFQECLKSRCDSGSRYGQRKGHGAVQTCRQMSSRKGLHASRFGCKP